MLRVEVVCCVLVLCVGGVWCVRVVSYFRTWRVCPGVCIVDVVLCLVVVMR